MGHDAPVMIARHPFDPIDPLGEALHFLRMSGIFYSRCEFTAPWGLTLPPFEACMMFHVVTAGQVWIEADGAEPCLVRGGDLALVPHGEGHVLRSERGAPAPRLFDLAREQVSEKYEIIRHGGGGSATTLICGVVRFDHPAARHLVSLLPRVIRVDTWSSPEMEWVQSTVRFIADEAGALRAGGETVITRLADILVIQAIRAWIVRDPAAQAGWLGALRDKQIGCAIALIYRDPVRDWTVASLAGAVGMSRSTFAARFTRLVGEPAMRHVARLKMQTALLWLKEEDVPLGELAARLGYDSEAAFSRAFKRYVGFPPAEWRNRRFAGSTPGKP